MGYLRPATLQDSPVATPTSLQHTQLPELRHGAVQQPRILFHNLVLVATAFSVPQRFSALPKLEITFFNSVILTRAINNEIVTVYFCLPSTPPPLSGEKKSRACFDVEVGECDRLCGLVVRVLGYRSGGPSSIPGTTKKK
jgi:hypothetical protein